MCKLMLNKKCETALRRGYEFRNKTESGHVLFVVALCLSHDRMHGSTAKLDIIVFCSNNGGTSNN